MNNTTVTMNPDALGLTAEDMPSSPAFALEAAIVNLNRARAFAVAAGASDILSPIDRALYLAENAKEGR